MVPVSYTIYDDLHHFAPDALRAWMHANEPTVRQGVRDGLDLGAPWIGYGTIIYTADEGGPVRRRVLYVAPRGIGPGNRNPFYLYSTERGRTGRAHLIDEAPTEAQELEAQRVYLNEVRNRREEHQPELFITHGYDFFIPEGEEREIVAKAFKKYVRLLGLKNVTVRKTERGANLLPATQVKLKMEHSPAEGSIFQEAFRFGPGRRPIYPGTEVQVYPESRTISPTGGPFQVPGLFVPPEYAKKAREAFREVTKDIPQHGAAAGLQEAAAVIADMLIESGEPGLGEYVALAVRQTEMFLSQDLSTVGFLAGWDTRAGKEIKRAMGEYTRQRGRK